MKKLLILLLSAVIAGSPYMDMTALASESNGEIETSEEPTRRIMFLRPKRTF